MKKARSRRQGIVFLLSLVAALVVPGGSKPGPAPARDDLNVLLISIDTIRPDRLGCYGSKYLKTPSIDALAARGVVFERAFAHTPLTLPSHANILLGVTPPAHGVHDNSKFMVKEDFLTLAEHLKGQGYATGAFVGAFPLDSRFGLKQGFDVYDESYPSRSGTMMSYPERDAAHVVQAARGWLETQNSKWFLFVHLWDPHAPYAPPPPFRETYKDDLYSGEVAYVDSELEKLFGDLERKAWTKKTLVILTGDHGEALGEHGELTHGYFAYDSTLWIPLIIAGPGIDPGRARADVCHIDIFPTVCDLLGMERPRSLQGVSLLSLIRGGTIGKRAIYFESLEPFYNLGCAPLRGFIEDRKKFLASPLPEFYDLENDFDEKNNLVQRVKPERYQKRLDDLMGGLSSGQPGEGPPKIDRETQEKLRSLGYIASLSPQLKSSYGPEDDLKTFLPLQQKLNQAIIASDEGRTDESVRLLNEIIGQKKGFAPAYLCLRQIYRTQGRFDQALAVLEEGYKNSPGNYDLISAYGILLIELEDLDKGIQVLQDGLSKLDFDPEVLNFLGFAYWKKGDEEKALGYYKKALERDDNFALVYSNLGALSYSVFLRTKRSLDLDQAMEYFKKAIECDPQLAIAYKGLGVCYRMMGRADAAVSVWERSLELSPEDDFLVLSLGKAHFDMGNKSQALGYFERYLSLKGGSLSAQERQVIADYIERCKQK